MINKQMNCFQQWILITGSTKEMIASIHYGIVPSTVFTFLNKRLGNGMIT